MTETIAKTVCATMKTASLIPAKPYNWPLDASFDKSTTALVIIDMQVDFCAPGGYMDHQGYSIQPARDIVPQIQALLSRFRASGFAVYHTREGHRPDLSTLSARELRRSRNNPSGLGIGDIGPNGRLLVRGENGHEIIPELAPLPSEPVVDKPGRSAFANTDFKLLLDIRGLKNLIVCGVTTDVCVSTTMRDANDMGMDCLIVSDATAAGRKDLHDASLATVCEEGGIFGAVASTADILSVF